VTSEKERRVRSNPQDVLNSKTPYRLFLCGRSGMGKTTLAVEVIVHCILPHVRRCYAVCPTFYEQPQLHPLRRIKGAFPKSHVFTTAEDENFEYIYDRLRRKPSPTLLLVDDAAAESSTNVGNKGAFARLCLAAPHLQLYIVGVFQRATQCSPTLRDNTEGVIHFMPTRIGDVQTLVSEFNPFPARPNSKLAVQEALQYCWDGLAKFCFIWRPKRVGTVDYYSNFSHAIEFQ
jgi:hypothetical protein